ALLRKAGPESILDIRSSEAQRDAEAAAALFEALGDGLHQGRALRIVAAVRISGAINEENVAMVRKALALARAAGDRQGEGAAYNALSNGARDLAVRLRYLK